MRNRFFVASGLTGTPTKETQQPIGGWNVLTGEPVDIACKQELERLIGLCEAPAVLWCGDEPIRAAEPFGMIA